MTVVTDPRSLQQRTVELSIAPPVGFDAIELCVVVLIVAVLMGVGLKTYHVAVQKARLTEAFSYGAPVMRDVVLFRSVHGTWPEADSFPTVGQPARGVSPRTPTIIPEHSGAFVVELSSESAAGLGGSKLSFRPTVLLGSPLSPVIWICGRGDVPKGRKVLGTDQTDIPDRYLPHHCRKGGRP